MIGRSDQVGPAGSLELIIAVLADALARPVIVRIRLFFTSGCVLRLPGESLTVGFAPVNFDSTGMGGARDGQGVMGTDLRLRPAAAD